jgi:hypothetical protein
MNNLENREIIVYNKTIAHMKKLGITPSDDESIHLYLLCKEIYEVLRTKAKIQINL